MALPSNRSSSPSMIAGRTSPNSRNSEIGNPIRRSFSGNPLPKPSIVANPRSLNPITLANSPSDYPRRNSISRENLFTSRDNEEKENGKDQSPKPVRVRSPTVGKSTKHFMSPTISAASKIAVSPKKKILGDRNEPVRSSLAFSGVKGSSLNSVNPNPEASTALESDTNPHIATISNPKSSKTVRFGGFEVITGSESTYRYDPEVLTMAVETNTKPEIAPIAKSAIAAAPLKASKTVKFGGFEVISDSYSAYDTNSEAVDETDTKPEIAPISNSPPKASKTVEFVDVEVISISNNDLEYPAKSNFTEEVDCVNLDPSFKISPVSSSMEVAPPDADPLMPPPYDPKTNYLSPRPQFLHYKPRRINQHELDGRLEELFSSANVSESEFTEETDSEDPQMESDEASSNESQMEEEEREEEEEEEEIINVSEQSPFETKNSSKLHFSRMFKISSLLLILFLACFSICVVNVHDSNLFERASLLTMEDSTEVFEFAKSNFNVLVGKLEVWHANSKSYISDMVFNIRGGRPLIYLNQTEFLHKDVNSDGQCHVLSHQALWEEKNNLNVMEEAMMKEREIDIVEEPIEREDQNEEEQKLLQEIKAMMESEINIEPVERDTQNEEEEVEEELFQEIEAKANDPKDSEEEEEKEEASAKSASEESLQEMIEEKLDELAEEENVQERQAEESLGFNIHDQIEQEASEESLQEMIEEKLYELAEEENVQEKQTEESLGFNIHDQIEQEASEESLQEMIEEKLYELAEEENVQEKQTEESLDFNIHDQIEQEAGTGGEREEEQNDTIQQSNTEFQYQSPPVYPPSEPQSDVEDENGSNIDLIGAATDNGVSRDFTQNTVVISAILGFLSLIPGLIYGRKSSPKPSSMAAIAEEQGEQPLLKEKKTNQNPVVQAEEEAIDDDDREEDIVAGGESCSSEMSSFQYSSMREDETEAAKRSSEEAQSHGYGRKMRKNSRRESMASSSLDEYSVSTSASPSYGSFTTYEKIPIKHGNAEEEIVTPVKRSSRIRKATQQ